MSGSGNEEYKKLNAHMLVGSPFPLDGTVPGPYLLEHSIKVAIIPSQEGKAFQKSSEELNCVPRNHHSFGIIFPLFTKLLYRFLLKCLTKSWAKTIPNTYEKTRQSVSADEILVKILGS